VWHAADISAVTHGWAGLAVAYGTVQLPLLAGLRRGGAPVGRWLRSPLVAAPATLVAGVGMSLAGAAVDSLGLAGGAWVRAAVGVGLSAATGYLAGRAYARAGLHTPVHQRGAVVHGSGTSRSLRVGWGHDRARGAEHAPVTLGGIAVAAQDEAKHFKLIGTTGTGKTTAIRELLGAALARGDRAIIADPDGGYMARFHDRGRGDVVLNPFDSDSVKWDLFGEIRQPYDADQLAHSLIPDAGPSDRSWTGYARTFFTAVMRQAHAAGVRDIGELYRLLVVAKPAELRTLVAGTPAQPFLEEQNARMFDSIRSVTSSAVGALEFVAHQVGPGFSIRDWVRHGGQQGRSSDAAQAQPPAGVLFMPYRAGQIAALRSSVSAWLRIGIFEAMDQPERDQRLWFVVDELDALGPIDGLKDALVRLRKFGGRCVLGFQSIAQVSSTYGNGDAQTIVENCGNTLVLRSSGSEHGGTSQFASRLIGQREVVRTTVSKSRRPIGLLATTTRSQHIQIEPAVLDAEIEQLPDREGYLKLASVPAWRRVRLPGERLGAGRQRLVTSAQSDAPQARRAAAVSAASTRAMGLER
jgi:hypothetical protein